MLVTFLGFLLIALVLMLVGAPFALVLWFPEQADQIVQISGISIPWLFALLLILFFRDVIQALVNSIAGAIERMKKVGLGNAVAHFNLQNPGRHPLSAEDIRKWGGGDAEISRIASHYYNEYLHATIFGSQFELLEDLVKDGPKDSEEIVRHYNNFLSRAEGQNYEYNKWLDFLKLNAALLFNPATTKFEITSWGRRFVEEMKRFNIGASALSLPLATARRTFRGIVREVSRPLVHQRPPSFEYVGTKVCPLDAPDRMRERRLGDFARRAAFRTPIPKT